MAALRIVLTVILILVSIVFTAIVLMEGALVKLTKVLGVVFMLLAIVLNINF